MAHVDDAHDAAAEIQAWPDGEPVIVDTTLELREALRRLEIHEEAARNSLDDARGYITVLKAEVEKLREALSDLLAAEWMVTHDWGGDREAVLEKARAALAVPLPEEPR